MRKIYLAFCILSISIACTPEQEDLDVSGGQAMMESIHFIHALSSLSASLGPAFQVDQDRLPECVAVDTVLTDSITFPVKFNVTAATCASEGTVSGMNGIFSVAYAGAFNSAEDFVQWEFEEFAYGASTFSGIVQITLNEDGSWAVALNGLEANTSGEVYVVIANLALTAMGSDPLASTATDVYRLTGTGTFAGNDESWGFLIHQGLENASNCSYLVKGSLDIVPEEGAQQTIDLGDGDCDGNVVVSSTDGNGEFQFGN